MARTSLLPLSLSKDPAKVRYSKTEREVFALLPQSGAKINSVELTEKFYEKRGEDIPFHGRTIMVQIVRNLIQKARMNGEPFAIVKSDRLGPYPIEFWISQE